MSKAQQDLTNLQQQICHQQEHTTAYTTTATIVSNTTTTNECILVRTIKVCRKTRQNFNIFYVC